MSKIKTARCALFSTALLILFSGCGTVRVPMHVTHPAEINMNSYKQIAISNIGGNMGQSFADGLKYRLVEGGRFKVVDRSRMNQIMKELNMSQSDLSSSENRLKLGGMLSASAMVAGHTEGKYKEERTKSKSTCTKNKVEYPCTIYYRKGVYRTSGSIDVIDVQTGEIVKSKMLNAISERTTRATDADPPSIDKDSLASSALSINIHTFFKAINPWTETVQVPFVKDKAIPDLERGINQAKMGELQEAIKVFADAAKAAEGNAKIKPKSIANAYFDLGLAYNFSWEFDKAIKAFKKAFSIKAKDDYLQWIERAKRQKAERKKLEEQTALK